MQVPNAGVFNGAFSRNTSVEIEQLLKLFFEGDAQDQGELGGWAELPRLNRADGIAGNADQLCQLRLRQSLFGAGLLQAVFQDEPLIHVRPYLPRAYSTVSPIIVQPKASSGTSSHFLRERMKLTSAAEKPVPEYTIQSAVLLRPKTSFSVYDSTMARSMAMLPPTAKLSRWSWRYFSSPFLFSCLLLARISSLFIMALRSLTSFLVIIIAK